MRDPARIARITAKLKQLWEKYPDMRLGQLVSNLTSFMGHEDPYHVEDEETESAIESVDDGGW